MYKIFDEEVSLGKVTPKALKTLKEIGIDYEDLMKTGELLLKIFTDTDEKLVKLLNAIFIIDLKDKDLDSVDLSEVNRGIGDFFWLLSGRAKG